MTFENQQLLKKLFEIIKSSQNKVMRDINRTIVSTYFEIGKLIVEEEMSGNTRSIYGASLYKSISEKLTIEFGKGFSETNIRQMVNFYLQYKGLISQTLSVEFHLSWSHYLVLMRISDDSERRFYEIEAFSNNWSLRELKRQLNSALYQRLLLSSDKKNVERLSKKGQIIETPRDMVKDPYVLEFLGLEEKNSYSESEFETALINKLQLFLLELGKGFSFVGRQVRMSFEEKHFKVDLVFYNRLLRSFVLVDLKIGEVTHQDIGQMQMYVNYYDRFVKLEDENKTVGIILCKDKNDMLVEITLPEENETIFASKYQTIIPSKEEFSKLIEKL